MPLSDHQAEILVVEDPMIQKLIHGILARYGYHTLGMNPSQALEHLKQTSTELILVTNKPELFVNIAGSVALLYVSSYPDHELASRFAHCRFLTKPFHPQDLAAAVVELAVIAVR